jgi:hypothetical protein
MDPYLEGHLWPDVHHRLASQLSRQLTPLLAPRYVARIVVRTVIESFDTGEFLGVMVPDVEVFASRRTTPLPQPVESSVATLNPITPAAVTVPQPLAYEIEIPSIEIRDVAGGILVTCIEILSPTNKRGLGWDEYQRKRRKVMQAQAHLLEIDLIRSGRRPVGADQAPSAPYYIYLTRAQYVEQAEVWPVQLRELLPIVPVPLRAPEADAPLNLRTALATIYDEARYDLSIDYTQPPEPPLDSSDAAWAQAQLGLNWAP